MLEGNVKPDRITYTGLFKLCVDIYDVVGAKMLHCRVFKEGRSEDCFISSTLVDLYGKFGLVHYAKSVFDCVRGRDLVCWNVMISCYVTNYMWKKAFEVYNIMKINGYKGDDFTITSLLKASATVESYNLGSQIHGTLCKQGWDVDVVVASALVHMYAKILCIVDARKAFDELVFKNMISWTTMIVGYGRCCDGKEAANLLRQMLHEGIVPDELALASIVSSCGNMSMTAEINEVHAFAMKTGHLGFKSAGNALVSAYSKCGSISFALQCFNSILMPDLVSWTSMIGAFAFHGIPNKAVKYFEKMLSNGIKPDRLAFLQVLAACTHGGNVDKGIHYFTLMVKDYNLVPQSEHYTCLVDLLGRAGLLNEAFNILISMPMKPGPDALAAFLGSCKVHENFELAKWQMEKLLELEPSKPVNYILMSNVYASVGAWSNASKIREMVPGKLSKKIAGCSWMETADKTHTSASKETFFSNAAATTEPVLVILHELVVKEHSATPVNAV
ncbi:hypothetical protein Leryth_004787 [Lithospermum erythrorhizon]|nr:hypothetical protein Leryth_004787 [Lithospermum erythrorhizon]